MNYLTVFSPELFQEKISRFFKHVAVAAFVLSVFLVPMAQDAHASPEPPNPRVDAYRPWVTTGPAGGRIGSQTTLNNCMNVTLPDLIDYAQNSHGETVYDSGCKKDKWAQQYTYTQ